MGFKDKVNLKHFDFCVKIAKLYEGNYSNKSKKRTSEL